MLANGHSIGNLFPILIILVILFEGNQSDIVILHRLKKTTVFNTSDDIELGTSFGDGKQGPKLMYEKAYLSLSEPLDACATVKSPPSLPSTNYYTSEVSSTPQSSIPQVKWVALITGGGGCDLKTKAIFAALAGYVRVIVKITHPDDVSGYNSLYEDEEIQVDISLLNPADWDIIQKYAYPKPYVILLPPPSTANPRLRTANRRVSSLSWALEIVYEFGHVVINFPYTVVNATDDIIFRCFKELLISPLKLDTIRFKEAAYAFICFLIPACMILGPFFAVLIYFSEPAEPAYNNRHRNYYYYFTRPPPPPPSFDSENDSENDSEDGPSRSRSVPNANNIISQFRYREALGLGLFEPLVKRKIESAFKREALKWHPDKNPGNQEEATKQFRIIKEAKDELLKLVKPEE